MRVVALGELLLRLKSPGAERLLQSGTLEALFGGSEFNVLASLTRFGHDTDYVTVLPEAGLGPAALAAVRAQGVGTRFVRRASGRLGLYFLESGSGARAPRVLYDRAASAFAQTAPDAFDWPAILVGADLLHLSGITPAVSASAAALAVAAAASAHAAGVSVSLDVNMRAQLWGQSGRDPAAALAPLLRTARYLFATPQDAPACLPAMQHAAATTPQGFTAALFATYPALELVVTGGKLGASASNFELLLQVTRRGTAALELPPRPLHDPAERIGAGDALVAGCLHGLLRGWPDERWSAFALAAQALKHTIPGDVNLATPDEIEMLVGGASVLRIQR